MEEILKQILGEIRNMKADIQNIKANMATKDDIANMATKDDIANMATKDDIAAIKNMLNGAMDIIEATYHEVERVSEIVNVHSEIIKDLSARSIQHDAEIKLLKQARV